MALQVYDLYINGEVKVLADGRQYRTRSKLIYDRDFNDRVHIIKTNENLRGIAFDFYKEQTSNASFYWKFIADINNIQNPLDLSSLIGKQIIIPDFNRTRLKDLSDG